MMDGVTYLNHGHTHCVPTMCNGATLTKIGQWLGMKLSASIMPPNFKLPKCTNEDMHVKGAHGNDKEPNIC